jgi:hypothetical protein
MTKYRIARSNGDVAIVPVAAKKRKIDPRNRPGPKPRDPIAAFERDVRRAAHLVSIIENEPFTAEDNRCTVEAVETALLKGSRDLSSMERMRLANELRLRGLTYDEVANVLGYADRSGARRAVLSVRRSYDPRR